MREVQFTYVNQVGNRRHDLRLSRPAGYMVQWLALPEGETWFRLKKTDLIRLRSGRGLDRRQRRVIFDRPTSEVITIPTSVNNRTNPFTKIPVEPSASRAP